MYPEFLLATSRIMEILMHTVLPIIGAIVGLGIIVFVHELGHLVTAIRGGITVEAFSIGFGPILWHKEKNGIDYRLSLIFFGGYCKLAGMEGKEGVPIHEIPGGFFTAKPGPRALCAVAGAGMNLIFALLVFTLLWGTGRVVDKSELSTTIGYIGPDSVAAESGLQVGDTLRKIDDKEIGEFQDIMQAVAFSEEDTITILFERDGQEKTIQAVTKIDKELGARLLGIRPEQPVLVRKVLKDSEAEKIGLQKGDKITSVNIGSTTNPIYYIGTFREVLKENIGGQISLEILRSGETIYQNAVVPEPEEESGYPALGFELDFEKGTKRVDPLTASWETLDMVYRTLRGLIVTKHVKAKGLVGPVGIINIIRLYLVSHWTRFLYMLAFISFNLAIVNLLPIPVFDGGHILFSLAEAVTKKRVPEKVMTIVSNAFAAVIIAFFLYVTFNDIMRFIPKKADKEPVKQEAVDAADTDTISDTVTVDE
jgi:regulator of sigma E protease